jgi:hypothetical protein
VEGSSTWSGVGLYASVTDTALVCIIYHLFGGDVFRCFLGCRQFWSNAMQPLEDQDELINATHNLLDL